MLKQKIRRVRKISKVISKQGRRSKRRDKVNRRRGK